MKRKLYLLPLAFLSFFHFAFQKYSSNTDEIDKAKNWFIKQADFGYVPDWAKAKIERKTQSGEIFIDIPLIGKNAIFDSRKKKDDLVLQKNASVANGVKRLVIQKNTSGNYEARLLNLRESDTNKGSDFKQITYNPNNFKKRNYQGLFWFEKLNGTFIEGAEFTNGIKTGVLTIHKPNSLSNNLLQRWCLSYTETVQSWEVEDGVFVLVNTAVLHIVCGPDAVNYVQGSPWITNDFESGSSNNGSGFNDGSPSDEELGCPASAYNSKNASTCYVNFYVDGIPNALKFANGYISVQLTDAVNGRWSGETYPLGDNVTMAGGTQLSQAGIKRVSRCKWELKVLSRPQYQWNPTSYEVSLMINQYGLSSSFTLSTQYKTCNDGLQHSHTFTL